jgi:hypothetical protein
VPAPELSRRKLAEIIKSKTTALIAATQAEAARTRGTPAGIITAEVERTLTGQPALVRKIVKNWLTRCKTDQRALDSLLLRLEGPIERQAPDSRTVGVGVVVMDPAILASLPMKLEAHAEKEAPASAAADGH